MFPQEVRDCTGERDHRVLGCGTAGMEKLPAREFPGMETGRISGKLEVENGDTSILTNNH